MSAIEYRFLEPLDVLFLRGNKLFGDPGSHGESLVPPWPSVAAGALRSRMLADGGLDVSAFARGEITHPELGRPELPGSFAVIAFHLARRDSRGKVELLISPPADLVIAEDGHGQAVAVRALTPTSFPPVGEGQGIASSAPLPLLPVLAEAERGKPAGGYWLHESGWKKYLAGQTADTTDLVKTEALWKIDARVGVGLDADTQRAADGRLFSMQGVAMVPGVGFLVGIGGANPPRSGTLRLGGDGRSVAVHAVTTSPPEPDYAAIAKARRGRLVLATPGIFSTPLGGDEEVPGVKAGWLPTGTCQTRDGLRFALHGVTARLVCAAISRAEIVSGWDLAALNGKGYPKPAQRAVPSGSVYWLEDLDATPDALRKLVEQGLWSESSEDAGRRRAEGFNSAWLASWPRN
jgi:CRISPR-associated protein Cmr3